jgi:drug/metabolite transporter superfamily protein YnfA
MDVGVPIVIYLFVDPKLCELTTCYLIIHWPQTLKMCQHCVCAMCHQIIGQMFNLQASIDRDQSKIILNYNGM